VSLRGPCAGDGAATSPTRFRVAGIARFPFEEPRERVTGLSLSDFLRACPEQEPDRANLLLVASRPGHGPDAAVAAIRRLRPDLSASTNEQIVARFQRLEFSYFRQISTVLATLTLFFAALLITVLLTVSVNQRLGEIAALRALGFSQRRMIADVLCRSLLLVGSGALAALPLGLLLSGWLDAILKQMPGIPSNLHFFVFEPRALYLYAALLSLAALLAALYPVWLVARLPIAATLRDEVVS
jgi:putative ABC transport system permease protein